MKIFKLCIITTLLFLIGCGTEERDEERDSKKVFDMWEYMTSPLNYEVEYSVYENGNETDYYVEQNHLFDEGNIYERRSNRSRTILYRNSNYILMKEPTQDVEIRRYVYRGENHVFKSTDIDNCLFKEFYPLYRIYDSEFENVIEIDCRSRKGVQQVLYYGFSEGIVAIYQHDKNRTKEYVKVSEKAIF